MQSAEAEKTMLRAPVDSTLEHWARQQPNAVAITDGDRSMSFIEWNRMADRLATALQSRGLGAGDIVVVRTHIRLEWSVIASALAKLGCSLLGMNWGLTPSEVHYVMNNSRASAIICDDADPAALLPAFERQALKAKISLDAAADGFNAYSDLVARDGDTFYSSGDPPLIIYTSGTTGLPKGVVFKRPTTDPREIEYRLDIRGTRSATHTDVFLVTMPMHHGSGPAQMWGALRAGAKTVVLRKFDALTVLDLIEKHKITHWTGVPTMYKRLAALPPEVIARHDRSSIKSLGIGAAPVSDELKAWIIDNLGDCLAEGYGSTETGMISRMSPEMQKAKPGSSGLLHKQVLVEIRDENGRILSTGQAGEIWVNTPAVIQNYLNAPPLGSETLDDRGFFRTGDMGRVDEDGYIYISDRAKDMIIRGGANIYPAEIEHALQTHPAVADAAAIGIPDDEFGESVMAFCELKPGQRASEPDLLAHCADLLAPYKRPKTICVVAELPRNTVGKLLKRDLRAPFWKDRARKV